MTDHPDETGETYCTIEYAPDALLFANKILNCRILFIKNFLNQKS